MRRDELKKSDGTHDRGYCKHITRPKTQKEIKDHSDAIGRLLDEMRHESHIAWDEGSTPTICKGVTR